MTGSAENDRRLLTRWDVPCPTCKAQPGQPCRRPNGDKATGYDGSPKFHAKRKGRVLPPAEECDNYRPPLTCLTAPSSESGRCDKCRTRPIPPADGVRESVRESERVTPGTRFLPPERREP